MNLTLTSSSLTSATLTWIRPINTPKITGYDLELTSKDQSGSQGQTTVDTMVTYDNLTPGQTYILTVKAYINESQDYVDGDPVSKSFTLSE